MYVAQKTVHHDNKIYPVGSDITEISAADAKRLLELGAIKEKAVVKTKTTKTPAPAKETLLNSINADTELTAELLDKLSVDELKSLAVLRGVEIEGLKKKADIIAAFLTPPVE